MVPNDPDPRASTDGSFWWKYSGLYTHPEVVSSRHDLLRLPRFDNPRDTDDFDMVVFDLEVREALTPNLDDYAVAGGAQTALGPNGLPIVAPNFKPTVTSCSPSSGNAGTLLTIVADQIVADTAFSIGGVFCTDVNRIDDRTFTAVAGAHVASVTPFDLLAIAPDGTTAALPSAFTYV